MKSRREFISGTCAGVLAGLAGCQGVLSSESGSEPNGSTNGSASGPAGESGSGPLSNAFLGDPGFDGFLDDSFGSLSGGTNEFVDTDVTSLRDHEEYLETRLATKGSLSQSATDGAESIVNQVDRTAYCRTRIFNEQNEQLEAWSGYVEGDVDAAAYEPVDGTDPSRTSHSDYDLYEYEKEPAVGTSDSAVVSGRGLFRPYGQPSDYPARDHPGMVRYRIDQLEARPTPADWIVDALEALRPYDVIVLDHGFDTEEGEQFVKGEAHAVHGEETTFRVVTATATAEQFDDAWDRSLVEQTLESEIGTTDAAFDVGETVGSAEATVPTVETGIGAET